MGKYQNDYLDEYGDERPKHRKMAASKKEKPKKADHKHQYKTCAVTYIAEDMYGRRQSLVSMGEYCTVCGKLDCNWMKGVPLEKAHISSDIPMFDAEMWDKAVRL